MRGELRHNPDDHRVETEYANVYMADMIVEATFVNPYSASSDPWDYGFIIRKDHDESDSQFIQVVVGSDRRWTVFAGDAGKLVGWGTIESLVTGTAGQNHLRIIAIGEQGRLFVNDKFIASFDLSSTMGPGDVAVITGTYAGTKVAEASTRFKEFRGDLLLRSFGPESGKLGKAPLNAPIHPSGEWSRELLAEATFSNRSGSGWYYYGFVIRHATQLRDEFIAITNTRSWMHFTLDSEGTEIEEVASGLLSATQAKLTRQNHLTLAIFGDDCWFLVNNEVVAKLELSHTKYNSAISAVVFYISERFGSLDFEDFNVWEP